MTPLICKPVVYGWPHPWFLIIVGKMSNESNKVSIIFLRGFILLIKRNHNENYLFYNL